MHFPLRIFTFEFFLFSKCVLFLWVPLEPIWTKLIFGFLWFSNRPIVGLPNFVLSWVGFWQFLCLGFQIPCVNWMVMCQPIAIVIKPSKVPIVMNRWNKDSSLLSGDHVSMCHVATFVKSHKWSRLTLLVNQLISKFPRYNCLR